MTDDTIESQLEIANASQADAGTYTCKAITLRDEAEKKVSNVKVYQATLIVTAPSLVEAVQGSKLMLDCDVNVASPLQETLQVLWFKDGVRLDPRQDIPCIVFT